MIFKIFKRKSLIVSAMISVVMWYAVKGSLCPWVRELPWNFEVALIAIFFFACGNMLSSLISISDISNSVQTVRGSATCAIAFVLSLAITLSLAAVFGGVDMGADYFGTNPVVFYVCGLSGSIMILSLSLLLAKLDFRKFNIIRNIGRDSLGYLALQIPVKGAVVVCIAKICNVAISDAYFSDWKYAILAFFITSIVLYFTIKIINYIKSKYNICYLI